MENAARLIITVLFIALMAIGVIFFGFMFIAPLNSKLTSKPATQKEITTSSLNIIEESSSSLNKENPLSDSSEKQSTQNGEEKPLTYPKNPDENKENTSSPPPSSQQPSQNIPTKPQDYNSISPADYKLIKQGGVISEEDIPPEAKRITIKTNSIYPSVINTTKGRIVLAITSGDAEAHIFRFSNPGLNQLTIGIPPYGTRLLIFEIYKNGEFPFYDDIPNSNSSGKLIVN